MKTVCILVLILLAIHSPAIEAQVRKKYFRVNVELESGDQIKGFLLALHDSAIHVSLRGTKAMDTLLPVKQIQSLSLRRKNGPGRGLGYGLLAGAGVGAIVGYASYSPPNCDGSSICFDFGPGLSAVAGGLVGGAVGSIVGLVGGSTYRKYMIYRDQPSYEVFKREILSRRNETIGKP